MLISIQYQVSVVNVFKWIKMTEILRSKMIEIILCLYLGIKVVGIFVYFSI